MLHSIENRYSLLISSKTLTYPSRPKKRNSLLYHVFQTLGFSVFRIADAFTKL
jgi:hypothetical protein